MKLRLTNVIVLLSICFTLNATNGVPEPFRMLETFQISEKHNIDNMFFSDIENELLFIDFEVVSDNLMMLNIWRNGKLMMEDDVTDLPNNTIYEINTQVIRKGTYTIELVTSRDIKIRKEFMVY